MLLTLKVSKRIFNHGPFRVEGMFLSTVRNTARHLEGQKSLRDTEPVFQVFPLSRIGHYGAREITQVHCQSKDDSQLNKFSDPEKAIIVHSLAYLLELSCISTTSKIRCHRSYHTMLHAVLFSLCLSYIVHVCTALTAEERLLFGQKLRHNGPYYIIGEQHSLLSDNPFVSF